jgi:hypothetical protein
MAEDMRTAALRLEEPTKSLPSDATCLSLTARLKAMTAERDAELAGKLAALEDRDDVADDRDRWRRKFYNLLVALLVIGAIGVGACIAEAAHVAR